MARCPRLPARTRLVASVRDEIRAPLPALPALPTVEQLAASFAFPLDEFQLDALASLVARRSVVVSVPTGSGKTVVGEAAVMLALSQGMRVMYTTPLKALSNQKYYDFCGQFGASRVGLLTGDVSVNAGAPLLVMTTEIYRNKLYRSASEAGQRRVDAGGDAGAAPQLDARMDDVFAVVLDEFHYMNDRDRGTVWEEAVISSPAEVQLVALSATMRNAADICAWMEAVHGPTDLIASEFRPVPLKFGYADRRGLYALFDNDDTAAFVGRDRRRQPGPRRRQQQQQRRSGPEAQEEETGDESAVGFAGSDERAHRSRGRGRGRDRGRSGRPRLNPALQRAVPQLFDGLRNGRADRDDAVNPNTVRASAMLQRGERASELRRQRRALVPSFPLLLRRLERSGMLPAIVFVFSRAGCDRAAGEIAAEMTAARSVGGARTGSNGGGAALLGAAERAAVDARLSEFLREHPGVVAEERCAALRCGVAAHHAGLLPLWKKLIEELFQDNLVKVVFATETLAAGINMPARTTVVTALSKRGDSGIVALTSSELLQMAGRAGRRGKDAVGHAVVMQSPWEDAEDAFRIATRGADALRSKFAPTYGMVLNLLHQNGGSVRGARRYVERSFGSFLARHRRRQHQGDERSTDGAVSADEEWAALEQQLARARLLVAEHGAREVRAYAKMRDRIQSEQRILGYLQQQRRDNCRDVVKDVMLFAPAGTPTELCGGERALLLGMVADHAFGVEPCFGMLMRNGRVRLCTLDQVASADPERAVGEARLRRALVFGQPSGVGEEAEAEASSYLHVSAASAPSSASSSAETTESVHQVLERYVRERDWLHSKTLRETRQPVLSVGDGIDDADADAETGSLFAVLDSPSDAAMNGDGDGDPAATAPEVLAQRNRIEHLTRQLTQHPLHAASAREEIIAASEKIGALETQARTLRAQRAHVEMDESGAGAWQTFLRLTDVLARAGCLHPREDAARDHAAASSSSASPSSNYTLTEFGQLASEIRSDNELWLATLFVRAESDLSRLDAPALAAVITAATVSFEAPRQRDALAQGGSDGEDDDDDDYQNGGGGVAGVLGLFTPSTAAVDVCERVVRPLQAYVRALQLERDDEWSADSFPVSLSPDIMGLVEAWARGTAWRDVVLGVPMDEGDVVRLLRRGLDAIRQLPALGARGGAAGAASAASARMMISNRLRSNARRAMALMDRYPVTDDVTYVVDAAAGEDEESVAHDNDGGAT